MTVESNHATAIATLSDWLKRRAWFFANYDAKLFPKRQYTKAFTTVNKNVYFPDKFLLQQKFVILQFPIVPKIN